MWDPELEKTFKNLKALLSTPALKGMALGARELAQQQMGYSSKELNLIACGYLACLGAVVAAHSLDSQSYEVLVRGCLGRPTAQCLNLKPESTIPESNPGPQQGIKQSNCEPREELKLVLK